MKSRGFSIIMPGNSEKSRRFEGIYSLCLHGQIVGRAEIAARFFLFLSWLTSTLKMRYVPPKRLDLSELHIVITHETVLSIVTDVRTSNEPKIGHNRDL
jgi:hypothetical protein